MRRIAVISACVLVGGLVGPSTALATEDDGHDRGHDKDNVQWLAVEDAFAVVLPDGTTFTDDEEPPAEAPAEEPPAEDEFLPVGGQLFLSEVLFATDDGKTPGDEIGRTHIQCTGQVFEANANCVIAFVLAEGSQLHGTVLVDFSVGEALEFDIAVTGGTGDFSRAKGTVHLTDITGSDDEDAETVTLYEPHLH